jgi:hypothetical protein
MIWRPCLGLVLAGWFFGGVSAESLHAAIQYRFRFDQAQYTVAPGGTVDVNVYLREEYDPLDSPLLNTEGLGGAGVRIDFGALPTAVVLSDSDIQPNNGLDFFYVDQTSSSAGFSGFVLLGPALMATAAPGVNEILLGSFTFTAGLIAGNTQIEAIDFDPFFDDNVTFGDNLTCKPPTALDALILPDSATITVAGNETVPEPASMVAWLALSTSALAIRWRRNRREPCF